LYALIKFRITSQDFPELILLKKNQKNPAFAGLRQHEDENPALSYHLVFASIRFTSAEFKPVEYIIKD